MRIIASALSEERDWYKLFDFRLAFASNNDRGLHQRFSIVIRFTFSTCSYMPGSGSRCCTLSSSYDGANVSAWYIVQEVLYLFTKLRVPSTRCDYQHSPCLSFIFTYGRKASGKACLLRRRWLSRIFLVISRLREKSAPFDVEAPAIRRRVIFCSLYRVRHHQNKLTLYWKEFLWWEMRNT